MAVLDRSKQLKKELGLLSVLAIATGTTLSSGLFLLPGLAAKQSGPAILLAYVIAAIPLIPASLSIIELATATPRAGGAYYFLDRSMGPMLGTIGGLGTWLALILKTAFALVGMGAYISLFVDNVPITWVATLLALAFGGLNLVGAKATSALQVVLVSGVVLILAWFIGEGLPHVESKNFDGIWDRNFGDVLSTASMVFVSYVGITKVASVSEEVASPEKNLPRGIIGSIVIAITIYLLGIVVILGVVPPEVLYGDLTPVASAAKALVGQWGVYLVAAAAIMAFSSVANAGILSASRYPLAMSRDRLLPAGLSKLSANGIPRVAVVFTLVVVLACILLFDPTRIAKLASAFQLLMFALISFAVIVMRESGIASYDPGFRSPFYPYMQIFGILTALFLLAQMGWLPQLFTFGLIGFSLVWFFRYAKPRVARPGAVLHVFERLGRDRSAELDVELRGIMKEKGIRKGDPFDVVVADSVFLDLSAEFTFESITDRAAMGLAPVIPETPEWIANEFLEGTRVGATPVSRGIALPHLRHRALDRPFMVIARVAGPVLPSGDSDTWGEHAPDEPIRLIVFLASPEADPAQHLRMLAKIARHAEDEGFMDKVLSAKGEVEVKAHMMTRESESATSTPPPDVTGQRRRR